MMQIYLGGHVAVVTGGGRGIGKATVLALADAGAQVFVWDVDEGAGTAVAKEIQGRFQQVDVTSRAEVDTAVAELIEAAGQLDILVNNAGIVRDAQFVKTKDGEVLKQMTEQDFKSGDDDTVKGVFHCTHGTVRRVGGRARGRVLNASSSFGLYA